MTNKDEKAAQEAEARRLIKEAQEATDRANKLAREAEDLVAKEAAKKKGGKA